MAEDVTIEPLVKICGLTRPQDVVLAVELGAWAVGFVFAPSPRRVTGDAARRLVLAARDAAAGRTLAEASVRGRDPGEPAVTMPVLHGPLAVGVFGESSVDAIVDMVEAVGLDAVQLHGARPEARRVREALADRGLPALVIRVIPVPAGKVDGAGLREAAAAAREGADLIVFDTRVGDRWGGTGRTFLWELAREAAGDSPYLVAGGLGPHNVRQAQQTSGAWGVDVSSGVEHSPGMKDGALLRALFAANQEQAEGATI
jgi:phosphoribosylanthranilate isomerase